MQKKLANIQSYISIYYLLHAKYNNLSNDRLLSAIFDAHLYLVTNPYILIDESFSSYVLDFQYFAKPTNMGDSITEIVALKQGR